jgi:HSP20 family protein
MMPIRPAATSRALAAGPQLARLRASHVRLAAARSTWQVARGTIAPMPWDPLRDLRAWQERLERFSAHHPDSWAPPIDVYETPDRYIVSAEVPGLGREDVDLAIEDSRITIRGHRPDRGAAGGDVTHFHQIERGHGAFARTFEFAEKIDGDRVAADLRDGVLTIVLPKAAPPPPRRIEVR